MATISQELSYERIRHTVAGDGLDIMGGVHEEGTTLLLLGPGPGFWEVFQRAAELQDGQPDCFDRWSTRVITRLASDLVATPEFPFGGPPYKPFLQWALASGRAWSSPVGMLVHDTAGLLVSFRGALRFDAQILLPPHPDSSPCDACPDQPCTTACPVGALSATAMYDVDACHAYLDTASGQACMSKGCIARRACPVSQRFDRDPAQSALQMEAFHRK